MRRCDVAHAKGYTLTHQATIDLGRRMRVTGIPGSVRFLCEDCAKGRVYPLDKYRMAFAGKPQ